MGIYLVGTSSNTWDFEQAYNAASDGDTIEFEKDFAYNMQQGEEFIITKNITLCGYGEDEPEGGKMLYSGMRGRIIVRGAEVVLRDFIIYSNSKTAALIVEENSKVKTEGSIIGNIYEGNDSYLVGVEDGELEMDNPTFINDNGLNKSIRVENGKVKIKNAVFDKIFIKNESKVFLTSCELSYFDGNVINAENSKIFLTDSYIEGGSVENDWPAVFLKNSQITIKDSTISQPNYVAAVYNSNNSQTEIENSKITSIKANSSVVRVKDSKIDETIGVSDLSLAKLEGNVEILGENPNKVDINVDWNSVIVGENLKLHRVVNPNIRISNESFSHIVNLEYPEGNISDLIFEIDSSSTFIKADDSKKATANNNNNNNSQNFEQTLSAKERLDKLIGLKKVKSTISEMLNQVDYNNLRLAQGLPPEQHSLHSAFVGNPGTGKTTVARLMGEILYEKGILKENKVVEVSRTDLVGSYKGHTGPQTRKVLESALGGVLFIDEAYTLMTGEGDNFGQEAIDEILKFMEDHSDELMIILAGYTKEINELLKANPGFVSRVPNIFDFEDYTPDEIVQMGEKILEDGKYTLEDKDYYEKYIKRTYAATLDKSNGRWIRNTNEKIKKALGRRVVETKDPDITTILNADIEAVMNSGKYENDGRKKDAYEQLNKLIGINKVKEQVDQFIARAEIMKKREEQGRPVTDFSLHSQFLGNPGTGKTTVARLIGDILYQKNIIAQNKFIEVSRSDLIGTHIGQTAQKTRKVLESALGGVLFIDEAYSLKANTDKDFGQEAVDEIMKFMEDNRTNMVIILAGYDKEMDELIEMNPGLRSRVSNTFNFEDYTPDEVAQIGLLGLKQGEYVVDEQDYIRTIKQLHKNNDGSNGRWARNINEKLILYMTTRIKNSGIDNYDEITAEDLAALRGNDKNNNQEDALAKLNNLIGISKVKQQVEEFIALAEVNKKRVELGYEVGEFSLHSQFLGNPGTGKTTVARLVGKILYQKGVIRSDNFIEVSRGDLIGEYIGHTAQKTRKVLESALGGVLFIDEAYSLKGNTEKDFGQEAIDEIMKFMEDNRDDTVVILAGYEKQMADLIAMNDGLSSRVPNTFDFEDYTLDEIVEIGQLGLDKLSYDYDKQYYSEVIKQLYAKTNKHSNGRWVRNINEKIIKKASIRVSKTGEDFMKIINEDIDKAVEEDGR